MSRINNELTYIFGAGASCQAMPLVFNFNDRFKMFIDVINDGATTQEDNEFIKACTEFVRALENHLSFDTFFKKLYHQNATDLAIKFKVVLLIYFIYEHLISVTYNRKKFAKLGKTSNNDVRYDALVAGLLQPLPGSNFFTNVNFLTWNYDSNLFTSLKNFIYPYENANSILEERSIQGNSKCMMFTKQCKLIHLNGIVRHPLLYRKDILTFEQLKSELKKLIEQFCNGDNALWDKAFQINFAWDSLGTDNFVLSIVKDIIAKSKNIVIVGYSFPLYNRLIDQQYLNDDLLLNKNVFIQDLDGSMPSVFNEIFSIKSIKSDGITFTPVKHIQNCRSFYIPKDIFI